MTNINYIQSKINTNPDCTQIEQRDSDLKELLTLNSQHYYKEKHDYNIHKFRK